MDRNRVSRLTDASATRRLRPVRPSRRNELNYRADLMRVVGWCDAVGAAMLEHLRQHWIGHGLGGDAAPKPPKDQTELTSRTQIYARLKTDVGNKRSVVRRNLSEVDKRLSKAWPVGVKVSGVDIKKYLARTPDNKLAAALDVAARANVELIESIPAEYLERVRVAISESFAGGERFEALSKKVKEIGDITERRAKIIARDQTSKMNASFNEVRQTSVGIKQYAWSGALDARERPSHRAMEGSVQRWDAPPEVDGENVHPGESILCRCVAAPVFDLAPAEADEERAAA